MKKLICILALILLLISTQATAQMIKYGEAIQLTEFAGETFAANAVPATNGTEWGVVFIKYAGPGSVYFLRCTHEGYVIDSHQLITDPNETTSFAFANLSTHPKGWAFTYLKETNWFTNNQHYSHHFVILDKFGRKTGAQADLGEGIFGVIPAPTWVDSMFVVFYSKMTSSGFNGVHMAFLDTDAKRIVPDVVITKPVGRNHHVYYAVPCSEGFALFGRSVVDEDNNAKNTTFYLLVGLDGTPLQEIVYLNNSGTNFNMEGAVWNGEGFALAGMEDEKKFPDLFPFSRLIELDGSWKGAGYRHDKNSEMFHLGIGWDGTRYISIAAAFFNATYFCRQLSSNMQPIGQTLSIDDSSLIDTYGEVRSNGSTATLFSCTAKAGNIYTGRNVTYQKIFFPHSGKPEVKYFHGKTHEFNGKQYVLFDWLVAGAESIKLKTKGGRWTLPATGFHAVEITKKSRYKITASNSEGNANAKLKIVP